MPATSEHTGLIARWFQSVESACAWHPMCDNCAKAQRADSAWMVLLHRDEQYNDQSLSA